MYNILTKAEKKIFRLYDNLDDTSLKALIDYYAYMETPIITKRQESEISNEPHPSDIASMVREEDKGAVGGIESPPEYQVGGFQNEFKKGENRQYDELIKSIKSRKTKDAIGIQWKNNEFMLGDEKVYFDNNNNIKVGKVKATYTSGLEQLLTKLTPDLNNHQAITDSDIHMYLSMLKQGDVEAEKVDNIIKQKYIFKKLADCYKRVFPSTLQKYTDQGVTIGRGLIILPSNPQELFKRLQLNIRSFHAGNKSLHNEINEIATQLYRMKILKLKQLKDILKDISHK